MVIVSLHNLNIEKENDGVKLDEYDRKRASDKRKHV